MCAARVLSDFYDRVTVYERDELPSGPANRAAVPQGRHVHLLMARGAAELESHFPGLLDDMVAAGVPILANRPDCIHFGAAGHVLGTTHRLRDEFTAYVPSRPQLEWQIRRRATAIANVDVVRASVAQPTFDAARQRVTGVPLDTGDAVPADLVVDAAGRGARLPIWLQQWGFDRPPENSCRRRYRIRHPPVAYSGRSDHREGRHRGRIPRAIAWSRHALLRGRHLGPDDLRRGQSRTATGFLGDVCAGRRSASSTHRSRDPAGRAHRRRGLPQIPDQPVAPLPQAGALSRPASCRSATLSPASTPRSGRA